MKGCLKNPPSEIPPNLIEQLLQDKYSFIKYRTIQYVKKYDLVDRYRLSIIKLRKDPSLVWFLIQQITLSFSLLNLLILELFATKYAPISVDYIASCRDFFVFLLTVCIVHSNGLYGTFLVRMKDQSPVQLVHPRLTSLILFVTEVFRI